MWDWFRRWRAGRSIERMTTKERYAFVTGEVTNLIASSSPVDPDNGCAAPYQQNMATSDVLGILFALKRRGYVIRKSWL
jgi:hypothetical protein